MTFEGLHILVIDDDHSSRQLIETFLKKLGSRVTCCESGESAYKKIAIQTFCCIVSDINMHGMSGLELLSKIRNTLRCDTPMVLISGNAEFSQSELSNKGAQGFLPKPYLLQSLENMILDCVR